MKCEPSLLWSLRIGIVNLGAAHLVSMTMLVERIQLCRAIWLVRPVLVVMLAVRRCVLLAEKREEVPAGILVFEQLEERVELHGFPRASAPATRPV